MAGRRTKLTPALQKKLVAAIRAGNYMEAACKAARIGVSTFFRWMERGEKASAGQFREFWEAIRLAESVAEMVAVAKWQKHIPDSWQAAKEFLARRFPERWAAQDKLTIVQKALREVEGMTYAELVAEAGDTLEEGDSPQEAPGNTAETGQSD
jgi:transposase